MAIQSTGVGNYLKRLTNIVQPNSAYTAMCWFRFNGGGPNTGYRTVFTSIDDPTIYTNSAGIFSDGSGTLQIQLDIENPLALTSFVSTPNGTWFPVCYVRSGNNHSFYVAGVLIQTVTSNISAETFGWMSLGSDTYDSGIAITEFYNYR